MTATNSAASRDGRGPPAAMRGLADDQVRLARHRTGDPLENAAARHRRIREAAAAGDPAAQGSAAPLLRGANSRAREGAAALERAHRLAAQAGAAPLVREVQALARRARVDLTDAPAAAGAADSKPDSAGLTPRQIEVLALVADGMTNREIVQRLFISEKTVGAHVSGILAALGVRSTVEAASTAHPIGLVQAGPQDGNA